MKDKEARKDINELHLAFGYFTQRFDGHPLKDLSIKDCPKCQHSVLAKEIAFNHYPMGDGKTLNLPIPLHYQCLTCGTKFTCSTKEVCEVIDGT